MLILIYFLPKGLGGNQYNSWNVANGSELIDPVTRQVREGVTKNTLLRDGKIMLFKLQCVETNNYGWRRRKNKLFHFIWLFERPRVFN
jgi:hypothetical protein